MSRTAYVNGDFVPIEQAKVSILDRGFLFADGVYEVAAVLDGRLVYNSLHLARLERSLREIALPLPAPLAKIAELQKELVRRNALDQGLVYMEVTRGPADRDFLFPTGVPPTFVMFTQDKNIVDAPAAQTGIAVKSVPDIRWGRRDIKSVGLLAQVLAKQQAAAEGCQEALLVEEDGTVTEGASSTAFIITHDGVVATRPNSTMILPGCTRRALQALAEQFQIRIEERPFTIKEAQEAAEVFITSASNFVMPVVKIDGRPVGAGAPGPLTRRLRELYVDHARATAE